MIEKANGRHVLILGFTSSNLGSPKAALEKLRHTYPSAQIQLMRADRIAGKQHLSFAVSNAIRAVEQGSKKSRSLAMEILLFASCQRQISKAIQMLGVRRSTRNVAVAAVSIKPLGGLSDGLERVIGGKPSAEVLEIGSGRKLNGLRTVFDISDRELQSSRLLGESDESVTSRLVIERSALLAAET